MSADEMAWIKAFEMERLLREVVGVEIATADQELRLVMADRGEGYTVVATARELVDEVSRQAAAAPDDRRASGSLAAAYRRGYRDSARVDADPGDVIVVPDDLAALAERGDLAPLAKALRSRLDDGVAVIDRHEIDHIDEHRCSPASSSPTPPGGAVLVARCGDFREDLGAPCDGVIRFRWSQSDAPCTTCGARCGVAVADWQRVEPATPPAETSKLAALARWLIAMDDPQDADGMRARQTVTLTSIIGQARAALRAYEPEQ